MNKEDIEELKDFTIDLTDIDELALGLEVCSKKSNMVIQEFADTIIQLQRENQELKEQLEYIRNGEYYNQVRFERDMLQDLVDKYKHIVEEIKKMFDDNKLNEYYYGMSYEFDINDFKDDIFKIIESENK